MKIKLLLPVLASLLLLITSNQAVSAIIKFNGNEVGAIDLNGISSSFEEFYDYRNASANTGLEIVNSVVMFIGELNDEYAIFTIANKWNSGGASGHLGVNITASSGSVSFADDSNELSNSGNLTFYWGGQFTDGYIYSGFDDEFTFTQILNSFKGVEGLYFVDFLDGTLGSQSYTDLISISNNEFTVSRTAQVVNAPSTIGFFLLFSTVLLATRIRTKR